MKIKAEKIKFEDLKPGDLFSYLGDKYWQNRKSDAIGERVSIRTDVPVEQDYPERQRRGSL